MKKFLTAVLLFLFLFTTAGQSFAASAGTTFSSRKLGWSISLAAGFVKNTADTRENEACFNEKGTSTSVSVKMYSLTGLTADGWMKRDLSWYKDNYSPIYFKVLKTEDVKLGGAKAKKVNIKYLDVNGWFNRCDIYVTGKGYRYLVSYSMASADYDTAAKKKKTEGMVSTFKFTEPNAKTTGALAEAPRPEVDSSSRTKLQGTDKDWTMEVPGNWKKVPDDQASVFYQVNDSELSAKLYVSLNPDNKTLDDCARDFESGLDAADKVTGKNKVSAKGTTVLSYVINSGADKLRTYLISINSRIYTLTLSVKCYADSPKNNKVLDNIWDSLAIVDNTAGNSIKDFTAILKGTSKGRIGDSYYNWSFENSKKLSVATRSFDGTSNIFTTSDGKCAFSVLIMKNAQNETLDSISANLLDMVKDSYTIIASEKRTSGNQQYAVLAYKGDKDNFVNEHRTFLVGSLIYHIILTVPEENYNSKEFAGLLDSFSTTFTKDGSMEDISDVNAYGYRTYKNRKFSWTMEVMPQWAEGKADNKGNAVSFYMDPNNSIFVTMFSADPGQTLDSWVNSDLENMNKVYNKQQVTISGPKSFTLNGADCRRIDLAFSTNGNVSHTSYFYSMGKSYRYFYGYDLEDAVYKNPAIMQPLEKSIQSFAFTEPDASKIGKLFDPYTFVAPDTTRKLSNSKFSWSVALPTSFMEYEENNGQDTVVYGDDNTYLTFRMDIYQTNYSLDSDAAYLDNFFRNNTATDTLINTESLTDKGTSIKKYTYHEANKGDYYGYNFVEYLLVKNGFAYYVTFGVTDIRYTDYSLQVFKTIWDSMTF